MTDGSAQLPQPEQSSRTTEIPPVRAAAGPSPTSSLAGGLLQFWSVPASRALIALLFILAIGCIFNANGTFFKSDTHHDTLRQASVFGILACGMTLVIISGGIDLAVGSVLGLVAVAFSILTIHWGWSAWVCVPICLLLGAACGMVSGGLTAWCGLQPFIATLAMMVFARGLAKTISGGTKVAAFIQTADGSYRPVPLPRIFNFLDSRILGGDLAVVTVVFLVCVAVSWVELSRHYWGRYLYAIGGNEEAARLSGIKTKPAKTLAYVACGLMSAVAGICQAAQEGQGDPEAGVGYELTAIAIVVIGGTTLAGGRGGIGLTLLGTLTIGYLEKILSINAVPEASRLMLTGAIIVVAVLAQRRRRS
ncbi:MAG: hypothetical protein C5B50_28345 [Verrucomicrobia bacterium]|nr:MAG: hypothetical protein C5B50_28345 [Verrucomicrobiota bacterium]